MELSWLMKLRIAASAAAGVLLIGIFGWLLTGPAEESGVVSVPDFAGVVILFFLAIFAGFIGYFVSWPYGRQIGVLAVPAGLGLWAIRSDNMLSLIRLNPRLAEQGVLFAGLKWESFFWLAVVAAGFLGVLIGQKLWGGSESKEPQKKAGFLLKTYLNAVSALVVSSLTAYLCVVMLAQDVKIFDPQLGSVVAQPATGQIVFAVVVSFGAAGFVVKKFLDASYAWPIAASALVTGISISMHARGDLLEYLFSHYPPVFFSSVVTSILPVQMVAFGAIGSVAGYWLAVRYNYWRKHEIE